MVSWGSSLSLLYAEDYPERCLGLIVRGIFLCSKEEITNFYDCVRLFCPLAWQEFNDFLTPEEQADPFRAYFARVTHQSKEVQLAAAEKFGEYVDSAASHMSSNKVKTNEFALSLTRICLHYLTNSYFIEDGVILKNVGRLRDIPITILQGEFDVICPPYYAYQLHKALPDSEFILISGEGHCVFDSKGLEAMIMATERFKKKLNNKVAA